MRPVLNKKLSLRLVLNKATCLKLKMQSMHLPRLLNIGFATLIGLPVMGQPLDQSAAILELQKQIKSLQQQVEQLKEGPPPADQMEDLLGKVPFKAKGLTMGFYGESKYRFPEAGANAFDAHRYVFLPGYQINDWLVFNSELEFEHGGIDETPGAPGFTSGTAGNTAARSIFDGAVEVEQFYVDILVNPHFNIRSLGLDVVPVGRISKYHEPTVFYSTERPELYREIIPTTWTEPSMGAFGKITDSLDYQLMVSTGLEDNVGNGTQGVTAENGMRSARPRLRRASENTLAYSGRLRFNGVRGLDASTSFYVATPKGFNNRESTLALWDIEALYRVPNTGLEFRGDFAYWHIERPGNLWANNNTSLTDNVGRRMYGWYVEAAYHFWPKSWMEGKGEHMDLVPFVRYSDIVTQSQLPAGSVKLEDGTANKDFLTAGVAWFLNPNFLVKADWRKNLQSSARSATKEASQDYFQLGVGMFF